MESTSTSMRSKRWELHSSCHVPLEPVQARDVVTGLGSLLSPATRQGTGVNSRVAASGCHSR